MRAVVIDVPMDAKYADETSGLRVSRIVSEFLAKHLRNLGKRVVYNYYLRDLSVASLELVAAAGLLGFGAVFGGWHWWHSAQDGSSTPLGTIMIATISVVSGLQFMLAFLGYDIANIPRRPLHPLIQSRLSALHDLQSRIDAAG